MYLARKNFLSLHLQTLKNLENRASYKVSFSKSVYTIMTKVVSRV